MKLYVDCKNEIDSHSLSTRCYLLDIAFLFTGDHKMTINDFMNR